MSSNENHKIRTNEEIVDELTKNFNNSTINSEETEQTIPNDFEDSDNESTADDEETTKNGNTFDDYLDEEGLKDLEVTFTETEKEIRHTEALALKNRGNDQFKTEQYLESLKTYTKALNLCPLSYKNDRSVLYANRAASKIQLNNKISAIEDCTKAIELNDKYIRAYLRRAKLYEGTEKFDEGLADYKKILELDPGNKEAISANYRLPPLINERNEKLKTEMFEKLKDLGNVVLKPFGLSTNNFKLQQDPNSGGYTINFQQNPTN